MHAEADGHCIADVDGDGHSDMVVAHDLPWPRGAISIHFHPGSTAVCEIWPSIVLDGMHTTEGARSADLDGNGQPEVIAANQSAPLSLWFPPEDGHAIRNEEAWKRVGLPGRLATPSTPRSPETWRRYPISGDELGTGEKVKTIRFSDLDADGDFDIFITSTVGTYWYENEGPTRNPNEPWTSHRIDPKKLNFGALGDLDGDGLKDVVVGNGAGGDGGFLRWLKRLHPTQNEWKVFDIPVPPDIKIKSTVIVDVDRDGKMDIVLGGTSPQPGFSTAIWMKATEDPTDAETRWVDYEIRPGGAKSDYIVPYDVDGDGDFDITFTNEGEDSIHWLENKEPPSPVPQDTRNSEP